jgi:4-amino-4-deoxy-L-arabinose transferase-like glycosyltransferase
MMKHLKKTSVNFIYNNPVFSLSIFLSVLILLFVCFVQLYLHRPATLFLFGDGYYERGKEIFIGNFSVIFHNRYWPGISFLYSWFNFFPSNLHPYLRIFTSLVFMYGNISIAKTIFSKILNQKEFFWAGIISFSNPLIIHWIIKTTPEVYVTFFLGLVFLLYKKNIQSTNFKSVILLITTLFIAMLIKPVFLVIPFVFLIYAFYIKRRQLIFFFSLIFISVIFIYLLFQPLTRTSSGMSYGKNDFIISVYFTNSIIKSGRYAKETVKRKNNDTTSNRFQAQRDANKWVLSKNYSGSISKVSENTIIFTFIKENFWHVIRAQLFKPLFFFSLADRVFESYCYLVINSILIFLAFFRIRSWYHLNKQEPTILILVLLGYSILYWLVYSMNRYSFPVMFYIGFLGGSQFYQLLNQHRKTKNPINES